MGNCKLGSVQGFETIKKEMVTKRIKVKRVFCYSENKYRLFLFDKGNYCGKIMEECTWIKKNDKIEIHFNRTHWGVYDKENNFYPIYNCSIKKPE